MSNDAKLLQWDIGAVKVVRVEEHEIPVPSDELIPEMGKLIEKHSQWLKPWAVSENNEIRLSIHSFLVMSENTQIIIDTCLGVSSQMPVPPAEDFPERLSEALGTSLESIDVVLCTHLHMDHVGWNMREINGESVPTFPNARYLFSKEEIEQSGSDSENYDPTVMEPSVQPIIDLGLADFVESDHEITSEVRLVPTPGHTPGHVSVLISSEGEEALITGDMTHSPIQFAEPTLCSSFDWDTDMSTATREAIIDRFVDSGTLFLGTHFAPPTSGLLKSSETGVFFSISESEF